MPEILTARPGQPGRQLATVRCDDCGQKVSVHRGANQWEFLFNCRHCGHNGAISWANHLPPPLFEEEMKLPFGPDEHHPQGGK